MKKILLITLLFIINACATKATIITHENQQIMIGKANKEDLQQEPFSSWFTSGYKEYNSDKETIQEIKNNITGISITIFMGTWCEDSQQRVPEFYKILDDIEFNKKHISLITMARDKTTPQLFEKGLNITNVPTFIFYKNGKEINRIVESPVNSLEKDFLDIISGKKYKHIYE